MIHCPLDCNCLLYPRASSSWGSFPYFQPKKSKSGTMPCPRRASASAPPEGRNDGEQRPAIRDKGGNERVCKQQRTRPAANRRSPTGTASSATEASTNRISLASTEHTTTHRERGQADKKQKGSSSHGMQKKRTAAGSKASTCSVWRLTHPRNSDSVAGQRQCRRTQDPRDPATDQ
jgi:hypothetical protein